VDTLEYLPLDTGYLVGRLRAEGELLAGAAGRAGLAAAVPTCPGWRVRDLLAHTGYVHRWANSYLTQRHTRWVDRLGEADVLAAAPADEALLEWFAAGHADLVRTLAGAGPDLECWTFLPAPSPAAFWARRQAHETAVHRVDAQRAAGPGDTGPGHPARFAIDGIDELIMGFVGRGAERGQWQFAPGVLGFHAADGEGGVAHWRVVSEPGHGTLERADGPADCDVSGPAGELYLRLWNRGGADGLTVSGDAGLLTGFCEEAHVTWG
jgi:uncharacterized protein (TIGR03083 family)